MSQTNRRIIKALKSGLPKAERTLFWLIKLILPISLAVRLLQYFGLLDYVSLVLNPIFQAIGLPGDLSIAFVCSVFLPTYVPAAIVATMGLTIRQVTIIAIMCLISHNTLVETAVQKKTGSSYLFILCLRIGMSFLAAFIMNAILPENMGTVTRVSVMQAKELTLVQVLFVWMEGAAVLCLKMALIITVLMMLQRLLEEFHIMDAISRICAPMMKFMGLSKDCSFLWFIANIVGLTYGSAILIEQIDEGKLSRSNARMLNDHLAISHSLLEDTLIFVAVGASLLWITIPRVLLAIAVVWSIRGVSAIFK